ncbi:MAG: L-rhamnose/proton symporter RhaT [Bacteroidota bacterium]
MTEGIIWAISAGLMLGVYALPEKYTKGFQFENTWGLFFVLTMFIVPIIASFVLIDGFSAVLASVPQGVLVKMAIASFLWGTGVMMWGKAINHIGLSLGFSLFIGTVILVGSLLPFFVEGLPNTNTFLVIMAGILVVLLGVIANGKAGLIREKDSGKDDGERGSMSVGISIAVGGGLLATGFSYANAVGRHYLHQASQALGNPEWVTAVAVMFPIFVSGGIAMTVYFLWQLTQKQAWGHFRTSHFAKNFLLILVMAVFHYAASAIFAYAAFTLGDLGNTIGYAIYNTASVATAIVMGILTKEWIEASLGAKRLLWISLSCMVLGIVIVAIGNGMG